MFTRSRLMSAMCAVLLSVVCTSALADSWSTTLTYDPSPNKILGASVTSISGAPSLSCSQEDYVALYPGMDIWDGVPDDHMWLCVQYQMYHFYAGTEGFLTNPASSRNLIGSIPTSYATGYAPVYYNISTPASGHWVADANHYYGYTSQYCPAQYSYEYFDPWNPYINIDWCTPGGSENNILLDWSSDEADAP